MGNTLLQSHVHNRPLKFAGVPQLTLTPAFSQVLMDRALQTWGVDQGWAANTWVIFVPWCRTAVRGYQDDLQPLLSHSPAEGEWDEEGEKHKAASLATARVQMRQPPGVDRLAASRRTRVGSGCCSVWQTRPLLLSQMCSKYAGPPQGCSPQLSTRRLPLNMRLAPQFSRARMWRAGGYLKTTTTGSPPS